MPRTVTVEQHAVFVTLGDFTKHRVSEWMDWTAALYRWTAMDDQRRGAQARGGKVFSQGTEVRHYEVRSENDPAYASLPERNLVHGFEVLSPAYASDTYAAKKVLRPLGYHSKPGGWVYEGKNNDGSDCVVAQGWVHTAAMVGHRVRRLPGETGYRAVVLTDLLVRKEV